MKSDEDYFSRNMTYFNVFLRILRLGEKYAYFTVFYNGFERTEQLCLKANWAGLICRTHQYYHRQWLPFT